VGLVKILMFLIRRGREHQGARARNLRGRAKKEAGVGDGRGVKLCDMRPFSPRRADGSPRDRRATTKTSGKNPTPKPTPKMQGTRRRNGRLITNGRTRRGRRLAELIRSYSFGLDLEDEQIAGLVKSTASIALEAEGLEEKSERGETIDHFAFARLVNTRERNLQKLRAMRAQPPPQPAGARAEPSALALHLAEMMKRKAERARRGAETGAGTTGEGAAGEGVKSGDP
jgi:hypothetical protein